MHAVTGKFTFNSFRENASARFWLGSAARINKSISRGLGKDGQARKGTSLVIGCPLPENILKGISDLRKVFDARIRDESGLKDLIAWREQPGSLHLSVFGILNPAEYSGNPAPWDFSAGIADVMKSRLPAQFDICYSGIGLIGAGVAIGVSDSDELTRTRQEISSIQGVSPITIGAQFNKVIIGRVTKELQDDALPRVARVFEHFEGPDKHVIGSQRITNFRLIHYGNEHLDKILDSFDLPLNL